MTDVEPIRAFLHELLRRKGDNAPIADDDRLITVARLDSVDVMETVVFLEDQYKLDFSERGVNLDDFDSMNAIRNMIADLQLEQSPRA